MRGSVLLISVWLALAPVAQSPQGTWWRIDTFKGDRKTGVPVGSTVLTVDMRRARMRVVSVPFELGKTVGGTKVGLHDFADALSRLGNYRTGEWVAVNGGFSAHDLDVPEGLLIVQGNVYSPALKERARNRSGGKVSPYSEHRLSGILCDTAAGRGWELLPVARYVPNLCRAALQAGPVIVEPQSQVGIAESELKQPAFVRTVLCLKPDQQLRVVLTDGPANLYPLARWLSARESAGGLGCSAALNLSGDTSAGMAVKRAKGPIQRYGDGSYPIPTALLFEPIARGLKPLR